MSDIFVQETNIDPQAELPLNVLRDGKDAEVKAQPLNILLHPEVPLTVVKFGMDTDVSEEQ